MRNLGDRVRGVTGEALRRIVYLFQRSRRMRELDDEMAFHREMTARSADPERRRSFGNSTLLHEQAREAWGWTWIDRLGQDLRYAARMLARSPGFTCAAVAVLAIGIGTNVFIFSTIDLIFLQPLPVRDPASLIRLQRHSAETYANEMPYSTALFYREHARSLSAVMTLMGSRVEFGEDDLPVRVNFVSGNFFRELGASAVNGRVFDPERDESGRSPLVAVLGHDFWQRQFHSDTTIVGRTIRLNRQIVMVIGVEPFNFPGLGGAGGSAEVWMPMIQQPRVVAGSKVLTDISNGTVDVWGRLVPGITAKMAEQELDTLTNELGKIHPGAVWKGEFILSEPGGHFNVMNARSIQGVAILSTLALLILTVACTNLGGLLLARGVSREHELAIRIAIGANRRRIFRQLFTESLLLAAMGSVAGLGTAYVALRAFLNFVPGNKWMTATPDWRVLLFVLGLVLVTAILFGFMPALQMARQQQHRTLARQVLVGAQIAASCVLAINASLLVRSAQHVISRGPGFSFEKMASIHPGLNEHGYTDHAARAYLEKLMSRLREQPGMVSVSLAKFPPLGFASWITDSEVEGHRLHIYRNWVDAHFLATMKIRLLAGRNFLPEERNAVIVSESMAKKGWPAGNAVGKTLWDKLVVVGIAADAHTNWFEEDGGVELYSLAGLEDMPEMCVVLRSDGDMDTLAPILRSIVQDLDPKLFPEITLLKSAYQEDIHSSEMVALVVSGIGVASLLLAGMGILGLVAFTVRQKTKEIAIQLALGAMPMRVVGSLLRHFRLPLVFGVATGVCCAAGLSRLLQQILQGVSRLDPLSYASAITVLLAVFAAAALLPARRAMRLDIARALHEE